MTPKSSQEASGGAAQQHSPELENDFPRMSAPARRALAGAGYSRLEQLTEVNEAEIAKLHGMGPKALGQLRDALAARGQSFAGNS